MRLPPRRWFTLMEVLVATALLGAVLLAVMLAMHGLMRGWQQMEGQSRRFNALLHLDRTLDNLLGNVVPFTWPDAKGKEVQVFVGTADAVTLAYRHELNRLDDGALRFCRLVQEEDTLVAYYCERPPFPADRSDPRVRRAVLITGVSAVEFAYYDLDQTGLHANSSWDEEQRLPLGVRLTLVWTDGQRETWLRRSAGMGYAERWGTWQTKELRSPP